MAPPNSVQRRIDDVADLGAAPADQYVAGRRMSSRRRAQLEKECRIELRLDRSENATRRMRVLSGQPPAPERF
jgi:hypothetical protein